MGFEFKKYFDILAENDQKILSDICQKSNVSVEEILQMLRIEKDYQFKERRYGIYEKLEKVLKDDRK